MATEKCSLTPEHAAQMEGWSQKWIARAMRTDPQTDEDRAIMRRAVVGMYASAKLDPIPESRVVFVPSPICAAFAAGGASYAWSHGITEIPVLDEPRSPSYSATYYAIRQAVMGEYVEYEVCDEPEPSRDAWCVYGEFGEAVRDLFGRPGLQAANDSHSMRSGGNQWSGGAAFVSFFRHVVGLGIDYRAWSDYEDAAIHGGPRYTHEKFCVVSDFPKTLLVDEDNEPHCEDGPFCAWSDGVKLYAVHGHYVPAWIIETPELLTVDKIKAEDNAETRRVMREIFGEERFLVETGAKIVHMDCVPVDALAPRGENLTRALLEDYEGTRFLMATDGSTSRVYVMQVSSSCETCEDAYADLRSVDGTFRTVIQA